MLIGHSPRSTTTSQVARVKLLYFSKQLKLNIFLSFILFVFTYFWGGLTNSCENKRSKKERYKHLNAQFQRTARRDKKAFLSNQCKEIEENNRMGKARDLFKKIRDTKGTFHAKIGTIKDRNGTDLTEAEENKKR